MAFIKHIHQLFTATAVSAMQAAIKEVGGREVLFLGLREPDGLIHKMTPFAWGNRYSVPSLLATAREYDAVAHNHPSGVLEPSQNDLLLANALSNHYGTGFYIINNAVDAIYTVVDSLPAKQDIQPLDKQEVLPFFKHPDYLPKLVGGFEDRPEQRQMALDIIHTFNQGKIAVLEAGTGTGKSFAYLVPAILWAKKNHERVVISTKTINLQHQLLQKDLPLLQKIEELHVSYALALGRNNYVCRRKLEYLRKEDNLLYTDTLPEEQLQDLVAWAKKTKTGLRSDFPKGVNSNLWLSIASENDKCHRIKCPFYETCHYFRAKRKLSGCDLIIANHYLLAYDVAIKNQAQAFDENMLLPAFRYLIMDEAHHIEEVMSKSFTMTLSRRGIIRLLNDLHHQKHNRGLLLKLQFWMDHLRQLIDNADQMAIVNDLENRIPELQTGLQHLRGQITDTFSLLFDSLYQTGAQDKYRDHRLALHHSLTQEDALARLLKQLFNLLSDLFIAVKHIFTAYSRFSQDILDLMDMDYVIFRSIHRRLQGYIAVLELLFSAPEDRVCWLEYRLDKPKRMKLHISPLAVNELLKDSLYDNLHALVCTSATLNVSDDFRFFQSRTGLDAVNSERKVFRDYPSTLLLHQQMALFIAKDLASPKNEIAFQQDIVTFLYQAMAYLTGGVLVLFTAKSLLNRCYQELHPLLTAFNKVPMRQGDMPRHRQLELFKQHGNGVLFATDSFWEGIDVPGRSLQTVIISRLPFRSPGDPVESARYDYIKSQGGQPFWQYALPKAVLLLKQGIGRLIRRRSDRGAIIILDHRIKTKGYGRQFIQALPDCPIIYDSNEHLFDQLALHFGISPPRE